MSEDTLDYLASRFSEPVSVLSFPGGRKRNTALYRIGSRAVAVSERRSVARAQREAAILRALAPHGIAPRLILQDGTRVVQEAVAGTRLPVALAVGDEAAPDRIARAWDALVTAQDALAKAGLAETLPALGAKPDWQARFADMPRKLGAALSIPLPDHEFGALLAVDPALAGPIKWDSRPGNAILRPDGRICWFDWEHAGLRNRSDDAVWFFADEWMPEVPALLDRAVSGLSDRTGVAGPALRERIDAQIVAHCCVRLLLIHDLKGDGPWWPAEACLAQDRVGVTRACAHRLSVRAAAAAARVPGLVALQGLFDAAGAFFAER